MQDTQIRSFKIFPDESVQVFLSAIQPFILSSLRQDWHLAHGDFLDGAPPAHSIGTLNQCVHVVVKSMRPFHHKTAIKDVVIEAMKFCAPRLQFLQFQIQFSRWVEAMK